MTKTPPITAREYRALAELRYVIRRFVNFSEAAAREAGVEPQQHQLLLALKGLPAASRPTIGAVAERLQLQHNSAVELAKRSIDRGLLERKQSESDRREVLLGVTEEGERVLARLSIAHRAELRSSGPALTQALEALVGHTPAKSAKRAAGKKG
jgi:DNA-binding MarR family transcriptional regulator